MIGRRSRAKAEERVVNLLQKTRERGATDGEEIAAVQLAFKIVIQEDLDLDWLRVRLGAIGSPPRYALTSDRFLVPTALLRDRGAAPGPPEEEVAHLLRRTRENGATAKEEAEAVQRAYVIVRQHDLDIGFFRMRLAGVGKPPRYRLTEDGFVIPADVVSEPNPRAKTAEVAALLRRTRDNGATEREEVEAVQMAYAIARTHRLDLDSFRVLLDGIGYPPRYALTESHFLVPADLIAAAHAARGLGLRRECHQSPTGHHRMVAEMRGTFPTGAQHCVHCGHRVHQ